MRGSSLQYGPMSRAAACHGGMVCYCRCEACAIGKASVAARLKGLEYMKTGEDRSSRSASGLAKTREICAVRAMHRASRERAPSSL